MTVSIQQAYIDTFQEGSISLAQQMRSVFIAYCRIRNAQSQNHRFITNEGLAMSVESATGSPVANFGHRQAQVYNDILFNQTWVGVKRGYLNTTDERHDRIQYDGQVNAPMTIMREHAYAYARWLDDLLIAAITGPRIGNQKVSVPFPAAQKKSANLTGNAAVKIDSEWVADNILQTYQENNAQGPIIIAIDPSVVPKLYSVDEYKNRDYTISADLGRNRLQTDYILPNWMNLMWVCSDRLLRTNSNKTVTCPVWQPQALALKENQSIMTDINPRPDLKGTPIQYTTEAFADATRTEDKRCMEVKLQTTA